MKIFKNHLKAARFICENFAGENNRNKLIEAIFSTSIVKCSYNVGSEYSIILIVDKYNLI